MKLLQGVTSDTIKNKKVFKYTDDSITRAEKAEIFQRLK